ncbi:unnamed protein product, partial [Allacma fusca]
MTPKQFGVIVSDRAKNMLNAFNADVFFDESWEEVQPGENASGSGQSGSDVVTDEEDFDVVENRGASEDDDNSIIADSTA